MSLRDLMADDAANVFCNPDDFGEPVTYTPFGGAARAINAVVWRFPPKEGDARGHRMRIMVANSATTGIASSEVNPSGDTVTLAYRPGQTPRAYTIRLVADDTEHMTASACYF